MGRKSRLKSDRKPAPVGSFQPRGYLPDRWTLMFVGGIFIAAYGLSVMQYRVWDYAYNATAHPVFHPWAVIAGLLMIVLSLRKRAAR
jgi:hypothetical protein